MEQRCSWERQCEEQDLKASGEGSLQGCDDDDRFCFTIWQLLSQ